VSFASRQAWREDPVDDQLVKLTPRDDLAACAEVLARAFSVDPMYEALLGDAAARHTAIARMFRGVLTHAARYGEAWTTRRRWGVAAWMVPGQTEVTFWQMVRTGFALPRGMGGFPKEARRTFMTVFGELDRERRKLMQRPHWYLMAIGVRPDRQGHGVGSALLEAVLPRADAEGVGIYLETQTERNVAFYQRRGFEVLKKTYVPELGIPLWSMAREAAT